MKDEQAERIAREVFALFDAHVSVPPELEAKLLRDVADKLRDPKVEWCKNCPFARHLHYDPDGTLVAPGCSGYEPLEPVAPAK